MMLSFEATVTVTLPQRPFPIASIPAACAAANTPPGRLSPDISMILVLGKLLLAQLPKIESL